MIYINQNFSQFLALSLVGASYTEFRVGTSTSTAIVVDWGDGSTSSYSGSFMTISHTYSSPFTGNMKISCPSGNNLITSIDQFSASNTNNSIAFTTNQIGTFLNLSTFSCLESNIISGNISALPSNLTLFRVLGLNTTTGDIANLPTGLLYYNNSGNNTTTGDIANLPINLIDFTSDGNNTTTGDIANLPNNLITYYNIGNNTTTGDIANLPLAIITYFNAGNNTTTGDIANLPAGLLKYYNIGNNTTTGDIANLPANMSLYENRGLNTVVDYTVGRVWVDPMSLFISLPSVGGLNSSEVDNLLIDLSTPSWIPNGVGEIMRVTINGNNSARTSASDTAVALLISKGVTVTTN